MKLSKIVNEQNWSELYKYIDKNKNINYFSKLSKHELIEDNFIIWNLLDELGMYSNLNENIYKDLEEMLYESYNIIIDKYADDYIIMGLMGYMIYMFPENYPKLNSDYEKILDFGKSLINISYKKDNCNVFLKYLYKKENMNSVNTQKLLLEINKIFKNNEYIKNYFTRILYLYK